MSRKSMKAACFALSNKEAVEVYNNHYNDFLVETIDDVKALAPQELELNVSDLNSSLKHTMTEVMKDRINPEHRAVMTYRKLDNKIRIIFY